MFSIKNWILKMIFYIIYKRFGFLIKIQILMLQIQYKIIFYQKIVKFLKITDFLIVK